MQWRYGGSININLLCAFLVIFITIPFTILVCNFLIMSIQVLASVKKGKPELRKKVQLCQQCLIYISIYLMLLQYCNYPFEELKNIAIFIYMIYIYQYFLPGDNLICRLLHMYTTRWCPLWSSDRGRPSEERTASSSTSRTMQVRHCGVSHRGQLTRFLIIMI